MVQDEMSNMEAAERRITDSDMAGEVAERWRVEAVKDSSTAVLGQANQARWTVLALVGGLVGDIH